MATIRDILREAALGSINNLTSDYVAKCLVCGEPGLYSPIAAMGILAEVGTDEGRGLSDAYKADPRKAFAEAAKDGLKLSIIRLVVCDGCRQKAMEELGLALSGSEFTDGKIVKVETYSAMVDPVN